MSIKIGIRKKLFALQKSLMPTTSNTNVEVCQSSIMSPSNSNLFDVSDYKLIFHFILKYLMNIYFKDSRCTQLLMTVNSMLYEKLLKGYEPSETEILELTKIIVSGLIQACGK